MKVMLVAVLAGVVLVGCGTTKHQEPQVVVQEVKILVPVKCKAELPQEPTSELLTLPKSAGLYDKGMAALRELQSRREYDKQIKPILDKCVDSKK